MDNNKFGTLLRKERIQIADSTLLALLRPEIQHRANNAAAMSAN
jgi:hypothetical protein